MIQGIKGHICGSTKKTWKTGDRVSFQTGGTMLNGREQLSGNLCVRKADNNRALKSKSEGGSSAKP
jgi:hypothetical protein